MQQSPDTLSHAFTKEDYFRDPFMFPNLENLQNNIDVAVELGLCAPERHRCRSYGPEICPRKRVAVLRLMGNERRSSCPKG